LVGPRDDDDPFGAVEVDVVADDRPALPLELVGEREVVGVLGRDLLGGGDRRIAERQPGSLQAAQQIQVGQVELHLPVEAGHRLVDETLVIRAVAVQRGEGSREQLRHQVQDPCFDVVHVRRGGELDLDGSGLALVEPLEDALDRLAVVGLVVEARDADAAAPDGQAVPHSTEALPYGGGLGDERPEAVRCNVPEQRVADRSEAAGAEVGGCQ